MYITREKEVVHNHLEQHHHQSCHLQPPLVQHPCNYHFKRRSPQPPLQEPDSHSVFTVENGSRKLPTGLQHHRNSEPLYQEIGERMVDGSDRSDRSDRSENRWDILNKSVSVSVRGRMFHCILVTFTKNVLLKTCPAYLQSKPDKSWFPFG